MLLTSDRYLSKTVSIVHLATTVMQELDQSHAQQATIAQKELRTKTSTRVLLVVGILRQAHFQFNSVRFVALVTLARTQACQHLLVYSVRMVSITITQRRLNHALLALQATIVCFPL